MVANYRYDAWGNCTIGAGTTDYAVANANPIRYRGYYYDDDTGLYYCNARYYSPKWRRFISPDDTAYLDPESVNGLNLYCYCNNDSVNYVDPTGTAWYNVVWDWMNIIAGVLNPISSMTAVCSVVVAACQGRWAEIRDDWNAGCLNPFNQSESVALKAKVLGFYKGSTIVRHDLIGTCSMFGTIWAESNISETTLRHEYGHSVQERILKKISVNCGHSISFVLLVRCCDQRVLIRLLFYAVGTDCRLVGWR